jgi:hypothetical protein
MDETPPVTALPEDDVSSEFATASEPFVGRWHRLVSTTNWEKGRIISDWRESLIAAQAQPSDYSDEAWSRRVGGVTGQHVGRLRRVFSRFGHVHDQYPDLYWSHFQAAVDWDDAEMWLEGAVQNGWSIARMRRTRWETLGAVADQEPRDDEIVTVELDEDYEQPDVGESEETVPGGDYAQVQGPVGDVPADADEAAIAEEEVGDAEAPVDREPMEQPDRVQPFVDLADLPGDIAGAHEAYKLAILRHKSDGWREVSRDDVLASLDSLKELATAPS